MPHVEPSLGQRVHHLRPRPALRRGDWHLEENQAQLIVVCRSRGMWAVHSGSTVSLPRLHTTLLRRWAARASAPGDSSSSTSRLQDQHEVSSEARALQ